MKTHTFRGGLLLMLAASFLPGQQGRLAERMTERMDAMAKAVDLSDDQRAKVEEIERASLMDMRGVGMELMEVRQALDAAGNEKEIDEQAAKLGKLTAQMAAARAKADLKLKNVLTAAQWPKYEAWRKSQQQRLGGEITANRR